MKSFRTSDWPVFLSGASLLVLLAACSPAGKPYEPPPPPSHEDAAPPAEAAPEVPAPPAADLHEAAGADAHDEDHDHAGEPHVHGAGDLSVTQEDDFLTVTLDAPLANFGLSGSKPPQGKKAEAYADGIAEPIGPTECEETERSVSSRSNGEHGALTISVVWRCKQINRIEGMHVGLFDLYPGFQHVDAIYLGPAGEQVAKELTPTDTELDFD